jgi:CHAT domain-containing protein
VRGLFAAGVPSVMLAEWEIDDDVTSHLLISFYGASGNKRRSQALQQAQLEIKTKYPHPYFWAGISLYGYGN